MKRKLILVFLLCSAAILLQAGPSYGRFTFLDNKLALDGYLQNQTSYRLHDTAGLVSGENRFVLEVDYKPFSFLSFYGSWRTIYDPIYDLASDHSRFSKNFGKYEDEIELENKFRALYADVRAGDFSFRVGRQQIVWGESDGLRLMDIINPLDERRQFFARDFSDIRIPLYALKAIYNIDTTSNFFLELVYIPHFKKNEIDSGDPVLSPRTNGPWSIPLPPPAFAPGPFGPIPLVPIIEKESRNHWFGHNQQYGGRLAREIAGWFVTLNFFSGIQQDPSVRFRRAIPVWIPPNTPPNPPSLVQLDLKQHFFRQNVAGFTFNKAFGLWVLRGEFATYIDEPVIQLDQSKEPDMVTKKTRQHSMIGFDNKTWIRFLNPEQMMSFSGQLFHYYTFNHEPTLAEGPYQQKLRAHWFAATLKINTEYYNGRIAPEVLIVKDISNRGWYIKPRVEFKFGDHWRPEIGALVFSGKKFTLPFGVMDDKDEIYFRLKYQF
jgi:hypothetical protein